MPQTQMKPSQVLKVVQEIKSRSSRISQGSWELIGDEELAATPTFQARARTMIEDAQEIIVGLEALVAEEDSTA